MNNADITLSKWNSKNYYERNSLQASSRNTKLGESSKNSNLVIEDNTIYEIDGECMNCLNREKNIK